MEYSHEIILPNDDIPFKMFIFEGREGNYVREKHWHRSVEIFALFEGELEFFINEKRYPLKPGEFMLVNSNEIHSIKAPEKNLTVVLQLPITTFEKYYTDDRFIYFSHSSRQHDEKVMQLIEDMYHTYLDKKCGYELKVQSLFYMLVYLLVTKYRKTEVSVELVRYTKKLSKLSAIIAYMKDNYTKELSLESVAKVFGYSPTYLSRMFQKYAKTNYKTYLDNIRLEHAYKELMNSDTPIGEIAMNNGFPNNKAFARVFKNKYGVLPSEFRREKR